MTEFTKPNPEEDYEDSKFELYAGQMGGRVANARVEHLTGANVTGDELPLVGEQLRQPIMPQQRAARPLRGQAQARADVAAQAATRKPYPYGTDGALHFPADFKPTTEHQPVTKSPEVSDSQRSLTAPPAPEVLASSEDQEKILRDTWGLLAPPKD